MKAELLKAVLVARLSDQQALDLLQEHGAVSDLCLTLADVAEADCGRAIDVLRDEMRRQKMEEPLL